MIHSNCFKCKQNYCQFCKCVLCISTEHKLCIQNNVNYFQKHAFNAYKWRSLDFHLNANELIRFIFNNESQNHLVKITTYGNTGGHFKHEWAETIDGKLKEELEMNLEKMSWIVEEIWRKIKTKIISRLSSSHAVMRRTCWGWLSKLAFACDTFIWKGER